MHIFKGNGTHVIWGPCVKLKARFELFFISVCSIPAQAVQENIASLLSLLRESVQLNLAPPGHFLLLGSVFTQEELMCILKYDDVTDICQETRNRQPSTLVIKEDKNTYHIYHFWYSVTFSVVGRILNDVVNRLPNLDNKKDTKDLQAGCMSASDAEISRCCGYTR